MGQKIIGFLRGQIFTSIIYILLGAALAFAPVESINIICKIVFGIMLAAAGIVHIILYVLERPTTTVFDLFSGVILVVFGVFLFQNSQIIVKVLPVLLGGFVLGDCVWTLRGAFRLKKANDGAWSWLLFGTIVFVALGIVMIINPFTVITHMLIFCGAVLLANGVLDLILQLVLYRGLKNAKKRQEELSTVETEGHSAAEGSSNSAADSVYTDWNSREEVVPEQSDESAQSDQSERSDGSERSDHSEKSDQEEASEAVAENAAACEANHTDPELLKPELTLEPWMNDSEQS